MDVGFTLQQGEIQDCLCLNAKNVEYSIIVESWKMRKMNGGFLSIPADFISDF